MLVISVPAFLLADKWGRRTSAITGGIGLSGCMFLIGSLYAAGLVHPYGTARWVVIVSVFLFGLTYCATWGIVGKIYATEIQPTHVRAAANCVAQGLGFVSLRNWVNPTLRLLDGLALTLTAHKLARGHAHPYTSGQVGFWSLLPFWWSCVVHCNCSWSLHARDERPITGGYPGGVPSSSFEQSVFKAEETQGEELY